MTHEVRIIPDKNTLTVVSNPSEEEQTPGEEEQTPGEEEQTPEEEETDNGILKDGEYMVDYSVLHETENEPSMADSYFTKPGKLIVKDGEIVAQVEMQSENIKELQVQSQPVKIVSSNETTQVVEFPVKDIFNPVNARIHVVVESINYDHWYDIRFQFDTSDLPIADNETGGQTDEPNNDDENNDSASGNGEDSNKDDSSNTTDEDLNYDRNGDQDSTSETNTDTNGSVINAKTGDTAQIMLYVALMIVSFVIIARKYRTRTL
ncbi:NEAT domain-containing protein [Niallia alba]|uniref:Sortase B protein-sorting domain-containing protein n=1 Tax=Niallia alba TaxID=2729105 RepID=A0A7Y0K6E4_9BACI|nr:NEAT domain-containing protein [Niallia alba]NMO76541.1 sortase B protein-sorting domain-containing protein [Niallia alba]